MIRVAVGILYRDKKILVAERPPDRPYSGYWEFPGGKIEPNETGYEALKRELAEELAIAVIDAELVTEQVHTYPDKTVSLEIWKVNNFTGDPIANENQQLRWVTHEELTQLRLLEGNWQFLPLLKF